MEELKKLLVLLTIYFQVRASLDTHVIGDRLLGARGKTVISSKTSPPEDLEAGENTMD
jgi:hypothetical protein